MNKWAQLIGERHRCLAIPMFIMVPLSAALRLSGNGKIMKDHPAWEAAQSVLILVLVLTGAWLYPFRLVNKRKGQRREVVASSRALSDVQ